MKSIDFSKVNEPVIKPIKPGDYKFIVDSVDLKSAKNDKEMVSLCAQICDSLEFAKRKVFENFVLDSNVALFRLKGFLESVGEAVNSEVELNQSYLDSLRMREFTATITNETSLYKGEYRVRPRISRFHKIKKK